MNRTHFVSNTSALELVDVAPVAAILLCVGLWVCGTSSVSLVLVACGAIFVLALSGAITMPGRAARASSASPERLGPYTLGEKIGQGGMGEVYRARHAMMDRDVAIKILPADHADEEARIRFEREARLTSSLESPNTVAVHDYGRTPDGRFYYVMELVDGYDLEELVQTYGPQPAPRVIHLLEQVCSALEGAHSAGLVHRDIKPANIAVCEQANGNDVVKVLDFGLVTEIGDHGSSDDGSRLVGTPAYLAPEGILTPDAIDARVDLYAVGAVAYWLLTGTPVFDGSSVVEICSHHIHTVPETPSTRTGTPVPADLEAVVMRCLAKDPAQRYASARALREALAACDAADEWCADAAAAWWRGRGRSRGRVATTAGFESTQIAFRPTEADDELALQPALAGA